MFDIGWSELLLIGVVALIVVGPKDLPHLFRALGRFTAKARHMAREFSSAMEDATRESGIDEATNSLRDLKSLTSKKSLGLDALDRAADRFEKWDPALPGKGSSAKRDPAAPAPGAPMPGSGSPMPGPAASASASPAPAAPAPAAPAPTAPTGTKPDSAGADNVRGAPRRRLHAVRRSDMKDS
ncbi:sec-independent protein translocase protein TatB [Paracoccus alcaliphilus]|uniref:Sec-independent protein translocase protein TatB n=1 Tax=Paracoccus alcaliphilus TaxID=34002 RepID=A0A1H8GY68_9RHOB|nr:Sec-independent protein translocase protein TatB [Paracoccus alcaliphilus]WCR17466.1 twin-arginine translocase subunit TatB [Paracoccus alcaliphilus]SEN49022.1 sec-independent protein translocase protein TatB [Paracoccus alcaliphilus]